MYNLRLEKAMEPEIKLPTSLDHRKSKIIPEKNIYFCFTDCAKAFVWIIKLWKILKSWEYQTTLPAFWKTCMQDKKQKLKLDMEQWTASKLGKMYVKAAYCHPAYLTYTQSISYEIPG